MWLHDWDFVLDLEGGTTDAKGWSYHVMADRYADTGVTGKAKVSGIAGHRARGRVWFRVAATPSIAREMEVREGSIMDSCRGRGKDIRGIHVSETAPLFPKSTRGLHAIIHAITE